MTKEYEQLREHTREVEQKNDDLERANRVIGATVSDLETMLNQAYEKNEFLELEVEDKESLTVKHQRVLDELRGKRIFFFETIFSNTHKSWHSDMSRRTVVWQVTLTKITNKLSHLSSFITFK